jgi:hypothetical protein
VDSKREGVVKHEPEYRFCQTPFPKARGCRILGWRPLTGYRCNASDAQVFKPAGVEWGDRLSLFAILLIVLLLAWLGGRFAFLAGGSNLR